MFDYSTSQVTPATILGQQALQLTLIHNLTSANDDLRGKIDQCVNKCAQLGVRLEELDQTIRDLCLIIAGLNK